MRSRAARTQIGSADKAAMEGKSSKEAVVRRPSVSTASKQAFDGETVGQFLQENLSKEIATTWLFEDPAGFRVNDLRVVISSTVPSMTRDLMMLLQRRVGVQNEDGINL